MGSARFSPSYNTAGLPANLARGGASTSFSYDAINRLSSLAHNLAGTTADVTWTQSHSPANQITSATRSNDSYAWTGAVNVNRTYAHNGLNQYATAGGVTFTYDANGNLTSDGANTYVYDVENRLISVSGAYNATLVYDPSGRLFEIASGGATTRFLYDGDALVAEYNGTGALLGRYVHGSGPDNPLIWYEGASVSGTTRCQLFANHQGSVVATTDASGNLLARNSYDEWGIPASTNSGRFGYTGQAWLSEIGLYYYKARIYSPTLGRFMQTDPVGYQDQVNLYAYVGNDPVNGVDPSGMATCTGSNIPCAHGGLAPGETGSTTGNLTDEGRHQGVTGGPLNGQTVDTSTLTPGDAPNAASIAQYYGGYYEQGPDGLVWHSLAKEAAIKMGVMSLSILGGEALAPLAAGIRGLAGVAGRETIVIGEDMAGRVIPTAEARGASFYNPPEAPPEQWMANNRNWINQRMDQGCMILDCGAAPGRLNYPNPTSPYYRMELEQIMGRSYSNYYRIPALGE